jgi:hypothetical protein
MSKTVLALYDDFDVASDAVEALVNDGFDRNDISIVAHNAADRYGGTEGVGTHDVNAGEGAGFGAVVGGLVGLGVALIPGIGPVLAAGPLGAAVAAGIGVVTGAATGGIVAGLIDFGVPEATAQYYAEGIRRGGALVSIELLDNDNRTSRAQEILNGFNPVNIDERGALYQQQGWSGFDENATPYNETQVNEFRTSVRDVSAAGAGLLPYADYQSRWRSSFDTNYAYDGTWEEYDPAYRFGYDLAVNPSYSSYDWDRLEMDARNQWEATRPNTWDRFKAAVREAWHDVTGR